MTFSIAVIGLSFILIIALLTDAYFQYKGSSINSELIKIYRQNIEQNRVLDQSIAKLKAELWTLNIKDKSSVHPLPEILREQWIAYQKENLTKDEKPFFQWTIDELAKRLTAELQECKGNCGMNYCDENGCIDRNRHIVDVADQIRKGAPDA